MQLLGVETSYSIECFFIGKSRYDPYTDLFEVRRLQAQTSSTYAYLQKNHVRHVPMLIALSEVVAYSPGLAPTDSFS